MNSIKQRLVVCSVLFLLGLSPSGCAIEHEEEPEAVYTSTLVVLRPDGTHEMFESKIRASEQRRLRDQRITGLTPTPNAASELGTTHQAISTASCDLGTVTFWSNPDATGNEICFSGTGSASLGSYSYPGGGTWSDHKNAMWTGVWNGYLTRPIDCSPSTWSYSSSELHTSQSGCNVLATWLTISS